MSGGIWFDALQKDAQEVLEFVKTLAAEGTESPFYENQPSSPRWANVQSAVQNLAAILAEDAPPVEDDSKQLPVNLAQALAEVVHRRRTLTPNWRTHQPSPPSRHSLSSIFNQLLDIQEYDTINNAPPPPSVTSAATATAATATATAPAATAAAGAAVTAAAGAAVTAEPGIRVGFESSEDGLEHVRLTMIPPLLTRPQPTPLRDKDPAQKSTPPQPVKGPVARQKYLESRPSLGPIARRIQQRPPSVPRQLESSSSSSSAAANRDSLGTQDSVSSSSGRQRRSSSPDTKGTSPFVDIDTQNSQPAKRNSPTFGWESPRQQEPDNEERGVNKPSRVSEVKKLSRVSEVTSNPSRVSVAANKRVSADDERTLVAKEQRAPPNRVTVEMVTAVDQISPPSFDPSRLSTVEEASEPPTQTAEPLSPPKSKRRRQDVSQPTSPDWITPRPAPDSRTEPLQIADDEPPPIESSDAPILPRPKNRQSRKGSLETRKGSLETRKGSLEKRKGSLEKRKSSVETRSPQKASVCGETRLVHQSIDTVDAVSIDESLYAAPAACDTLALIDDEGSIEPGSIDSDARGFGLQTTGLALQTTESSTETALQVAGVQATAPRRRGGRQAPPKLPFGEVKLRRISITELADAQKDEGGRPKRVKIPPLQWWRNERIEYEATDALGTVAYRAKAIYKADPAEPTRKKKGKQQQLALPAPAPATERKRSSGKKISKREVTYSVHPVSADWLHRLEHSTATKSTLVEPTSNGDIVRVIRWKQVNVVQVASNSNPGRVYSVKVLAKSETVNSCMIILGSGRQKGLDKTQNHEIVFHLLSGETRKVKFAVTLEGCSTADTFFLSVGDLLVLPAGCSYEIENCSRVRTAQLLLHIL